MLYIIISIIIACLFHNKFLPTTS